MSKGKSRPEERVAIKGNDKTFAAPRRRQELALCREFMTTRQQNSTCQGCTSQERSIMQTHWGTAGARKRKNKKAKKYKQRVA